MTSVANAVPSTLARVIPSDVMKYTSMLGKSGVDDVFVTAAKDLKGITSSEGISQRLTLMNSDGSYVKGPFTILEFNTPKGIASPVFRDNPGFIGQGKTKGGAREFVIPNMNIKDLTITGKKSIE